MNGLLSECCSAKIDTAVGDGGSVVGHCACCRQIVCRKDARTGKIERCETEARDDRPSMEAAS